MAASTWPAESAGEQEVCLGSKMPMQRIFSTNNDASPDVLNSWSQLSEREFYEGDLEIEGQDRLDFSFDKSISYPVSLTKLSARCSLGYRRTWNHIRSNKIGVR